MKHRDDLLSRMAACEEEHHLPLEPGEEAFGVHLRLRRFSRKQKNTKAVLILHGANSSSDTFLVPDGGLAAFLSSAGWDVWLLDWRGSPYVMAQLPKDRFLGNSVLEECKRFNYDYAAEHDVPDALAFVRSQIGDDTPLSFIGHCVGGGIAAMAIARGVFDLYSVEHVVLVALGLFYEVPWDGWVKAEDFILERILIHDQKCRSIDPSDGKNWPKPISDAYAVWPCPWLPDDGAKIDLLKRISFMVGKPWAPELLAEGLDTETVAPIFGPMHLGIYLHSGQMVRRGYAAPFEAIDVIDRSRLHVAPNAARRGAAETQKVRDHTAKTYLVSEAFETKRVTLVTGSDNRVWHRDSIDLMYDWLRNGSGPAARHRKCIVPGFGLQDLFWRAGAKEAVWPHIAAGIDAAGRGS